MEILRVTVTILKPFHFSTLLKKRFLIKGELQSLTADIGPEVSDTAADADNSSDKDGENDDEDATDDSDSDSDDGDDRKGKAAVLLLSTPLRSCRPFDSTRYYIAKSRSGLKVSHPMSNTSIPFLF
ncbi:hypothetical protein L6452_44729 [Arctium lappa]|nr:hypothetical protein L6452_44729 [Arctium lappa]